MSGKPSLQATFESTRPKLKCVLGLGVACVDIIACVQSYPEPDEKIRADSVEQFSGGNVGNTLTAISKLRTAAASILTKVGKDSNGDFYLNDLRKVDVDVRHVIVSTSAPTLSVYVIVDRQARRTCIASPNEEELTPSEVTSKINSKNDGTDSGLSGLLDDIQLVHLDSRHTEAAVVLAREANQRKVFVSLDVEKNRVFLADLLPLCDIFFTNKEFSEVYFKNRMKDIHNVRLERNRGSISDSSEESSAEFLNSLLAMSFLFYTDPAVQGVTSSERSRAEFAVTTRGSLGSLLMRRKGDRTTRNRTEEVEEQATANSDFISENLLENAPIQIDEFLFTRRNSDSSPDEVFEIIRCAAWPLRQEDVVDSTGAGDAFIGGFISGWVKGYSDRNCMKLGTSVAAVKLGKKGARDGLPTPSELNYRLQALRESEDS